MSIPSFGRRVLSSCVAATMLAACGGSQPPIGASVVSAGTQAPSRQRTFKYTGRKQSFKVPRGVAQITVAATGASGGYGDPKFSTATGRPGEGGFVTATIPVTPGERVAISVGGSGSGGGFNGGGGGRGYYGGNGGGASDVRQGGDRLTDRVVVA